MRYRLPLLLVLMLAGCVSGGQEKITSIVSTSNIAHNRYHNIVVFIENTGHMREDTLADALKQVGVNAEPEIVLFDDSPKNYSNIKKGKIIRNHHFDASLYVTVLRDGLIEQPAPNIWYDGKLFHGRKTFLGGHGFVQWQASGSLLPYIVNSEGKVVRPIQILTTNSELQDTSSAKIVWSAHTSISVPNKSEQIQPLFEDVARSIVQKLRSDHVI